MKELTNRHNASLAAVMLMAHAVPIMVQRGMIEIEKIDASFVASYIRLGKWFVYACATGCGMWLLSMAHPVLGRLDRIAQLVFVILIIAILLSIIVIVHDEKILNDDNSINWNGLKTIIS